MSVDSELLAKPPLTELLLVGLVRVVALGCLFFGLREWGMLIGYSDNGAGRFDLLPLHWKTASTSLAVLYPVAAVGLWLRASWGPVLWVGIAAAELAMHLVWTGTFGPDRPLVLMIVMVAVLYAALRIVIWRQRRALRLLAG